MSAKKISLLVGTGISLLLLITLSNQVVETNNKGFYQIKQAAVTGTMSAINKTGMYLQLFADVHTYKISDTFFFDGTAGSNPITVRFQDGGTAHVHGSLKYRLSTSVNDQLKIHEDFRSDKAVRLNLIAPIVQEAMKQSAPHMTAEDSYSTKRSEFTSLVEDQVTKGIFDTYSEKKRKKDPDGNVFIETNLRIKSNEDGSPMVKKESTLKDYNIQIIRFVITDIDYDDTIDNLISLKKKAEQEKVVARANAEKSKQDAITAKEEGNANIAIAKAAEEVEKIKAVTKAQKDKEVAELQAQKEFNVAKLNAEKELRVAELQKQAADETAKAKLVLGESEAKVAKLKVAAGLTPLQAANINMETQIGVARELAKLKLPGTFIAGGGGSNGGSVDPFTAIGLESLINIKDKMSKRVEDEDSPKK